MLQTATVPAGDRLATPLYHTTETLAERNLRLYGCPLDHTPNAETIAAIQECEDMRRGKIPKYSMPVADFFAGLEIEL